MSGLFDTNMIGPDRTFDYQAHDWVQHGRQLVCSTCPANHKHGTLITSGLMLVGKRGAWELVPERGIKREDAAIVHLADD